MRAGDIVFINGGSPVSKIVRMIDGGPFSHVAVAVSGTHIIEAQYFTKVKISEMKYKDFEVVDLGLTDEQRDEIVHLAIEMIGRWYDYLQILWYFLSHFFKMDAKKIWNSKNNLICSELVDYLLFQVGYLENDIFLGNVTPKELYYFLKKK